MIEAVVVTLLPVGFLVILFAGGALFMRNNIGQDGEAPINRALFYGSKYAVVGLWGVMVLQAWGIGISVLEVPPLLKNIAVVIWILGFGLLYIARFEMGGSFRLGTPKEPTSLKMEGLFGVSRNPMYVGMYATIVASVLYTLVPVVIILGAFVVAVHHAIVLKEEVHLERVFGRDYLDYRHRVRRYV